MKIFSLVLKFIVRKYYGLPKKYKNIWYNRSCYMGSENYPKIYDENNSYIYCRKGLNVIMGKTKEGKNIYYKVVKQWRTSGGDFLSSTDAINCDLEFSYIK